LDGVQRLPQISDRDEPVDSSPVILSGYFFYKKIQMKMIILRLYSSAIFEDMSTYPSPEILNKPIEQLVLFLKSMGFAKIANFPFPTSPRPDQITAAEARLIRLGALTTPKNKVSYEIFMGDLNKLMFSMIRRIII
jgi:hypothetical protein